MLVIGANWRCEGINAALATFDTKTKVEIVVVSGSRGRSAFANAGGSAFQLSRRVERAAVDAGQRRLLRR